MYKASSDSTYLAVNVVTVLEHLLKGVKDGHGQTGQQRDLLVRIKKVPRNRALEAAALRRYTTIDQLINYSMLSVGDKIYRT